MKIKIAPSILSAKRDILTQEVKDIEQYSDLLHIDIMDGKFVPPITFLADEIKKIKSKIPLDVHLMVIEPEKGYIEDFAQAGASIITIHAEACKDIPRTIEKIKKMGLKAGLSINPRTPIRSILPYINDVDMILIMSVNPGYAGQKFIPGVLPKIRELRKLKPNLDIEVDGGINLETVREVVAAGANVIVAGSFIFDRKDRKDAIQKLKKIAEG